MAADRAQRDDGARSDELGLVIDTATLPRTRHAHEFEGANYGDVPFSVILVHAPTGAGPAVHRHPYAEVFIVDQGQAEFQLGDRSFTARQGQIVVGPPDVPHGFRNHGVDELRITAIHGAGRFITEWLEETDSVWASKR